MAFEVATLDFLAIATPFEGLAVEDDVKAVGVASPCFSTAAALATSVKSLGETCS